VLQPDVLDVIESELMDAEGGWKTISYDISLSSRPTELVRVDITLDIRTAACYQYGDKFKLLQHIFLFGPDNYNVSQTVAIYISRLNKEAYEGSWSVLFRHSVASLDEAWKSAYVRPVTVTLQDDSRCPDGAVGFDAKVNGQKVRKCRCDEGHFIERVDPSFCDSVTNCTKCPDGMKCEFQQNYTHALIDKGHYRATDASLTVVKCPDPSTQCMGRATSGDGLCAEGHEGPFCMVCKVSSTARYVWSGEQCERCSLASEALVYAIFALLGLLCVGSVFYIARTEKKQKKPSDASSYAERFGAFAEKTQTRYKILITFTQILSKITPLYPLGTPPPPPDDLSSYRSQHHSPFVFSFLCFLY
jgi:hypothetical protein